MSLPLVETPRQLKSLLKFYKKHFTKKQYKHFRNYITGLIVSDNKTIQEINDCFNECNQSSLNRFLTKAEWDCKKVNKTRLMQIKRHCNLKKGILIVDPTMLHKTGKKMEKANYHYSGVTKSKEWGHLLVDSFFMDPSANEFPVCADIYLRECDADKTHPFKTTREICLEHIDYAKQNLPIWLVMLDAGLYADFVIKDIKLQGLKYIAGVRITNNISIDGNDRISISDYLDSLTDTNFNYFFHNGETYFLHTVDIYSRGVGKEKLLISYKEGDEENIKIYTTNVLNKGEGALMSLLLKRWEIECLHRDAKQHLGLEDYQVRKFGAIQKVVCAVLVAYTQVILSRVQAILCPIHRTLETIGEGCRFLRLVALKGMAWLKRKAKRIGTLKDVLNSYVFVKNAKV